MTDIDMIRAMADEVWAGEEPASGEDMTPEDFQPEPQAATYPGEDRPTNDASMNLTSGLKVADPNVTLDQALQPDGPNFSDNAGNSFEQEVALKFWVDTAVDMLNRGEAEQVILAKLGHDGCPDPRAVLRRALEQPPVDDTPEPDPNPNPAPAHTDEPPESNTMPANQLQASVIVNGRSGKRIASWTDAWGEELTKVAFDDGRTEDVPTDRVQEVADAVDHPVDEIRDFIAQFPEADPDSIRSLAATRERIREARSMCHDQIARGNYDAVPLEQRLASQEEQVMQRIEHLAAEADEAAGSVDTGRIHAPMIEDADLHKEVSETLPIMMHDASLDAIRCGAAQQDCMDHLALRTAHLPEAELTTIMLQAQQVVSEAAKARLAAAPKTPKTAAVDPYEGDFDGPCDELFW